MKFLYCSQSFDTLWKWVTLHLVVMTKGNQFKDGGHRRPNPGEVGSWLTLSHVGFGDVVLGSAVSVGAAARSYPMLRWGAPAK